MAKERRVKQETTPYMMHGSDRRKEPHDYMAIHSGYEREYKRAPGHVDEPGAGEPPPDPVTESIRAELLARQRVGWRKYSVGLGRPDFSVKEWVHHLYEELLDAAQYSKRLMMTLDGSLLTASNVARWKHVKRGTSYAEAGRGRINISTEIKDGDVVVIYRSEADGSLEVRSVAEFEDGRFERLPALVTAREEMSKAEEVGKLQRDIAQLTSRLHRLVLGDQRQRVSVEPDLPMHKR